MFIEKGAFYRKAASVVMSELYQQYNKQDFLDDDSFVRFVRGEQSDAWEEYVQSAPPNLREFQAARAELQLLLTAKRILPSATAESEVWESIRTSIEQVTHQSHLRVVRKRWMVAAAAAAVLVVGITAYFQLADKKVHTEYGKLASIMLPDSSEVLLNANSTISYKKNWENGQPREIWLNGEAYFEVRHLKQDSLPVSPSERFIVHTKHLDVEVLGTVFNVKERRGVTEVGLRSGAVQLKSHQGQQLLLQPGDVARFTETTQQLQRTTEEVNTVSAWKNKQLIMNNMTVQQITQLLEDTYGYQSTITDSTILNKKIQGDITVNNEDDIIFILSGILKMNIEKKDHMLIFKQRN
ncbi:FecR family protein [Chitinophaga sp. sic0106]|uniref:FecR family protein n=1 Tax=Chitinophaga sp. sic0106 TaxID=2854785 RepID=UPI001C497867|nr:FecR domain-containing protein [Chitinophaga sp. sic0106]